MENGKSLKFIFFSLILAIFLLPVFSYAYSDKTTHPALTNEAMDIFNYKYPDLKLSEGQKSSILNGSIEEDSPTYRPLNHFYDPVYDVGLLNVTMSAKSWSQNTRFQAGFSNLAGIGLVKGLFESDSDYSWDRAVYDYVYGNKERALEALGHNLHLIQDMAVPPHVRNDQHLSGVDDSPYEIFTKQFDKDELKYLSDELRNKDVVLKNSLDEYFDSMATFTNSNFFSKDTILIKKYINPILSFEIGSYGYGDFDNKSYKLVMIDRYFKDHKLQENYYISDLNNLILTDYWNILSKQAVLHSAGVIKLFFDDVEKEKKTLALYNKNKSFLAKIGGKIASIFSSGDKGGIDLVDSNLATAVGSVGGGDGNSSDRVLLGDVNNDDNSEEEENSVIGVNYQRNVDNLVDNVWVNGEFEGDNSDNEFQNDSSDSENNVNLDEALLGDSSQNDSLLNEVTQPEASYPGGGFGGGGVSSATNTDEDSSSSGDSDSDNNSTDEQSQTENLTTATSTINIPDAPVITYPDLIQKASSTTYFIRETLTSSTLVFAGVASSTNIISSDFSTKITPASQNNEWSLSLENLNQGTTTVNFYASNQDQTATSSATTVEFFVDSEAPDISLVIQECENSISQSGCLFATASTTVYANWGSTKADLDYFILNKNGTTSTTTATTTQISISGNQVYSFGVSAVDQVGNISQEESHLIQTNEMPVVINEVAWAGTKASSNDEWIELYNNTDKEINLENWTLYAEDNTPYIPLSGVIPANGFYLLERNSDDNSISDIDADLTYGNDGPSWALNNSKGEHLILALNKDNSTTTVDEIIKANNWALRGHASPSYTSMERYDSSQSGYDWNNWSGNNVSLASNGLDSNGDTLSATPKAKNSVSYLVAPLGTVDFDKTLKKENSPYIINNSLTIKEGVTLSVEAGVVVKIIEDSNRSVVVRGSLQTNGTQNEPVVFTSFTDDEFGGDLNGDGLCESNNASSTSACPYVGSWKQVLFEPTSQNSYIKGTIFRYGGYYANGQLQKYKGMVTVDNSDILVENSVFEYSKSRGLQLIDTTENTLVSGSIFRENNYEHPVLVDYPYGLWVERGSPLIQNNIFENNKYGVVLSNSSAVVNSNTFTNNTGFAMSGYTTGGFSKNTGSGNGLNGIVISGNLTQNEVLSTLKYNQLPYVVDYNIGVSASSTLIIDPGVIIKLKDRKFEVEGRLEVKGEIGNPVLFTSIDDDGDGVDVQNNAPPDTIRPGNYRGVYMESGSTSEIKNAEFRYSKCGVSYENSPIYLENVTFRNNTMAICFDVDSATTTMNNLIFEGNKATSTKPLW